MDNQKQLFYLTKFFVNSDLNTHKLRGVTAEWRESDHTACISFYFDGPVSEKDREAASDICTGIIADYPDGLLEENYIRLDRPSPLPESDFWAFKQP